MSFMWCIHFLFLLNFILMYLYEYPLGLSFFQWEEFPLNTFLVLFCWWDVTPACLSKIFVFDICFHLIGILSSQFLFVLVCNSFISFHWIAPSINSHKKPVDILIFAALLLSGYFKNFSLTHSFSPLVF
jgi:hypothetical protein